MAGSAGDDSRDDFRELYRRTVAEVHAYLRRGCLGDVQRAEDLTQEVYLAAYAAFGDRAAEIDTPWLVRVARNKLVDSYRRLERDRRRIWRAAREPSICERAPFDADDQTTLVAALRALPPAAQAAIVLRYLDDLAVADVAAAMGKSVRATESNLRRALARLRRAMEVADD